MQTGEHGYRGVSRMTAGAYQTRLPAVFADAAEVDSQCLLVKGCLGNGHPEHVIIQHRLGGGMDFRSKQTADVGRGGKQSDPEIPAEKRHGVSLMAAITVDSQLSCAISYRKRECEETERALPDGSDIHGESRLRGTHSVNPPVRTRPLNTKNPGCHGRETAGKALWESKEEASTGPAFLRPPTPKHTASSWRRWDTNADTRDALSKNPHREHQPEAAEEQA